MPRIVLFCDFIHLFPGHLDALLRGLVLGRMGRCGHPQTVSEAQKRFEAHCKGEAAIPADLRSAVYSTVLRAGNEATLEAVMKLLKDADLHEEKMRLMRCMGSVKDPELIKKVLSFSLSVRIFCFQSSLSFFLFFFSSIFFSS